MTTREVRTKAKSKGRVIVVSIDATHVYLRPLGKHRRNALAVSIADVFALARRRASAERARDKARLKRINRKLRKAAKLAGDCDGLPNVLTSVEELFLLAHLKGSKTR